MTFRDDVIELLGARRAIVGEHAYQEIAGFSVPRRYLPVRLLGRPGPHSGPLDCRKESSLLVDRNQKMSCIEVEIVRALRVRWQSGWVQGYPCGRITWGDWQWSRSKEPLIPDNVAAINDAVQAARGKGRTFAGHPDVAVTDGRRIVYIECKMKDEIKPSQIEWFNEALHRGIVRLGQVLIVQGAT